MTQIEQALQGTPSLKKETIGSTQSGRPQRTNVLESLMMLLLYEDWENAFPFLNWVPLRPELIFVIENRGQHPPSRNRQNKILPRYNV